MIKIIIIIAIIIIIITIAIIIIIIAISSIDSHIYTTTIIIILSFCSIIYRQLFDKMIQKFLKLFELISFKKLIIKIQKHIFLYRRTTCF